METIQRKKTETNSTLNDAKQRFVNGWGTMASEWGISRSMAQVHAILLVSNKALTTDEIMSELNISRGGANTNLHDLLDWNLIWRVHKTGERIEYFEAEKDPWKIFRHISKMKKRREIDPLLNLMNDLSKEQYDKKDKDAQAFYSTINNINTFGKKMDNVIEKIIKSDESWFLNTFLKFFL